MPSSAKIEIATSKSNGDSIIKRIRARILLNNVMKIIKCFK